MRPKPPKAHPDAPALPLPRREPPVVPPRRPAPPDASPRPAEPPVLPPIPLPVSPTPADAQFSKTVFNADEVAMAAGLTTVSPFGILSP